MAGTGTACSFVEHVLHVQKKTEGLVTIAAGAYQATAQVPQRRGLTALSVEAKTFEHIAEQYFDCGNVQFPVHKQQAGDARPV